MNAAVGSTTTALQSDTASFFSPLTVSQTYKPDLAIICLDINDWIGGVTPGTYDLSTSATHSERLRKIVLAMQVTGDVILLTGFPSKISSYAKTVQDPILYATRNLADICGVPLIDIAQEWGDYVAGLAAGYYAPNNDPVHPGIAGYADAAARVAAQTGILG